MTKTIGFIQVKGGDGRSTLATNIAGMIAEQKTVALIDCDMPQGSSSSWYAVRQESGKVDKLTCDIAHDYDQLIQHVEKYSQDHDYIVIDATPRIAQITMAALILSDLAIVPIESSIFDIWASVDLVETIEKAMEKEPELLTRLVWNKYEANTNEAKVLSKMAKEELGLKEMTTKIGRRTAYKVAARLGMTVREGRNRSAHTEITELGREIQKLLKTKFLKDE